MSHTRRRALTWAAFLLAHVWLALLGVVVVPAEAFWDLDLYRWWMHLAFVDGQWPVLDGAWVYPAGALVPLALPALATTTSTVGYAVAWCVLVTVLDVAAARAVLSAAPAGAAPDAGDRAVRWWTGFLVLLGPVAIGRLDAVIAPIVVVALLHARRHPVLASVLLTAGAWVKVAPGALLLALVGVTRDAGDAVRRAVLPALGVCVAVALAVGAGGGLPHLMSFLGVQGDRDLQVEAVAATPWMLAAALGRGGATVALDEELNTYEVLGPGARVAADALDAALPLAMVAVAFLVLLAWRRGNGVAMLLPAAMTSLLVLVVTNKVGSPQFMTWLAPPVVVLLAQHAGLGPSAPWHPVERRAAAGGVLAVAALTQAVFPWGYMAMLEGHVGVAALLALRNVLLVALLVGATVVVVRVARRPHVVTA